MQQSALSQALMKMKDLVDEARRNGFKIEKDGFKLELTDEWRGFDHCPYCQGSAMESAWTVSKEGQSVTVWEIMFHYAETGHIILNSDIPAKEQKLLISILN